MSKPHNTKNNGLFTAIKPSNWIYSHEKDLHEQAIEALKRAKELEAIKQSKKQKP